MLRGHAYYVCNFDYLLMKNLAMPKERVSCNHLATVPNHLYWL